MASLNRNEMEAMRILWLGEPLKPSQIQEQFTWKIENATLRSALALLVDKGLATREKQGKAFYYRAKGSQHGMLSNMARRLAQIFTGGSTIDLIAQLIRNEQLSRQEIDELRCIAEEKGSESPVKGAG